jgi:MoaA/NifB/PqqE/SkfB family radical SAM enzyme
MKTYGFHPFVRTFVNENKGIIYDLLDGSAFQAEPKVIRVLRSKTYQNLPTIEKRAKKLKMNLDEIKRMLDEGMRSGLILELNNSAWRGEILAPLEYQFLNKSLYYSLNKLIIQPYAKCNYECKECKSYVNCSCFADDKEWDDEEIANFIQDLERYKNAISKVDLIGGNLTLYDKIKNVIKGIEKAKPRTIEMHVPIKALSTKKSLLTSIKNEHPKRFLIVYDILPGMVYEPYLNFISSSKDRIQLFLDSKESEDIEKKISIQIPNTTIRKKHMLKKDLSNIDWYKKVSAKYFFKGVTFYEFSFRKYFHRCWGCSFSIDHSGKISPCLWSSHVFGIWETGRFFNTLMKKTVCEQFWLENTLAEIPECKDCIYRYGCEDCRVVSEFLAGGKKMKNPLCEMV